MKAAGDLPGVRIWIRKNQLNDPHPEGEGFQPSPRGTTDLSYRHDPVGRDKYCCLFHNVASDLILLEKIVKET
jgi:hypothetical protein